jgi:hypothetical protein
VLEALTWFTKTNYRGHYIWPDFLLDASSSSHVTGFTSTCQRHYYILDLLVSDFKGASSSNWVTTTNQNHGNMPELEVSDWQILLFHLVLAHWLRQPIKNNVTYLIKKFLIYQFSSFIWTGSSLVKTTNQKHCYISDLEVFDWIDKFSSFIGC